LFTLRIEVFIVEVLPPVGGELGFCSFLYIDRPSWPRLALASFRASPGPLPLSHIKIYEGPTRSNHAPLVA